MSAQETPKDKLTIEDALSQVNNFLQNRSISTIQLSLNGHRLFCMKTSPPFSWLVIYIQKQTAPKFFSMDDETKIKEFLVKEVFDSSPAQAVETTHGLMPGLAES